MTSNSAFINQNTQQNHRQQTNGFLMNGTNSTLMMNSLNAGSLSGRSTVGDSNSNSTQSTGTGGAGSANNSLNNGYGGQSYGVPIPKQFDTESVISIKSERVGLGAKTNLPNGFNSNGLGRTHSSLSHYNNGVNTNSLNNGQQFVNYGFIGPNKLSSIFPQQFQQQQLQNSGSQNNLPNVYFPPQIQNSNTNYSPTTSVLNCINNENSNNLSFNSQQNNPQNIQNRNFNSMSNVASNQPQFTSLINNQFALTDNQNQFNNLTINNRQRSVGRLERRVLNNNFKNNTGLTNNFSSAINNCSVTNNFDDSQSIFNDACTAITGNTSEHSFAMDSEYKLHYKGSNLNGLFSDQYKNCLKTIRNLNENNDEQLSISSTTSGSNYTLLKCQLFLSKLVVNSILLVAYLTSILMIILPKTNIIDCKVNFDNYHMTNGDGSFITLIIKLIILMVAFFALFSRKNGQKILYPRFALYKLGLISLTFLLTLIFWLVYFVRIAERKFANQEVNYLSIINYAVNFVDCLNLLFFLAVILIEIKHTKSEYIIKITRNPDGETHVYSLGDLSIQRTAVFCLEMYYRDFTIFNNLYYHKQQQNIKRILELNCQKSSKCCDNLNKKRLNKLNHLDNRDLPTLKYYDIDKPIDKTENTFKNVTNLSDLALLNKNITENPLSEQLEQLDEELNAIDSDNANINEIINTEKLALPMKNMHFMANKRLHEENDQNRKIRKRSNRLELSIHHSFNLLRRTDEYSPSINANNLMECNEAATTVFPFFASSLQKFLRTTRQQLPQLLPLTKSNCDIENKDKNKETEKKPQQIIQYLATCLKYDLSPSVFLKRFQSETSRVYETVEDELVNENFNQDKIDSLSNEHKKTDNNPLSKFSNWSLICDELSNRMVNHGTEFLLRKDDVSLFVTISKLPDFAISEEVINPNCNKFVLSSETCV